MALFYDKLSPGDKLDLILEVRYCQVCGFDAGTQVDHDHKTGWVRGVVCQRCNSALGWFERMSERALARLKEYVLNPPLGGRSPKPRPSISDWRFVGAAPPSSDTREAVLAFVRANPGCTARQIAGHLGGRGSELDRVPPVAWELVAQKALEDRGGRAKHAFYAITPMGEREPT